MKRLIAALFILLAACASPGPSPTPYGQAQQVQATQQVTSCAPIGKSLAGNPLFECSSSFITDTPTATATATQTATPTITPTPTATDTPTAIPLTATPAVTATVGVALVGWHGPGIHLDPISHLPLQAHEHGAPPPAWTAGQSCVPFSQTREGHVFYKGMLATDKGGKGVESYMIVHVASTAAARAHGDHDIMAFFKTPGTGKVSCYSGLLDFGTPPPLVTTTVDPGTRPIILSKFESGVAGFSDCETWYNRPGSLPFDLGWTICNRWQKFSGAPDGGNGAHRGADWHLYVYRFIEFPWIDPGLAAYAIDDGFGHLRLDFVVNDVQFPDTGVTGPN